MAFDVKQVTVGASAVQLYGTIVNNVVSVILVRADPLNTATVWYGPAGVTTTTGRPLLASEELEIPIDRDNPSLPNETEYYFISDTASQHIAVHAS